MSEEKSMNEQLLAAADGKLDEVKQLIACGADVDFGDKYGESALMNACRGGHNDIVHYLVNNAKANVNLRFGDKNGWTALMFAGYFGHRELIVYLVANHADPTLRNKKDQSVFDMEPCMNATKAEVAAAIEQGKELLGNAPDILKSRAAEFQDHLDAESEALKKRAEAYTQISSTASSAEALTQFKQLYTSTCKDFHQEPVGFINVAIDQLIRGEMPDHTLDLARGSKNDKIVDSQLFPLFEVLGHGFPNCPFTTIDLSFNKIRNSGAKAIAVYLTQTKNLTTLDLSGNNCEQLGIEKLAQALYGQHTLTVLKIGNNPAGDVGMAKLAEALLGNTKINEVDLGNTDLGTVTLMKLASVLRTESQISKMNISNPLLYSREEETTIAIAKALGNNMSLTELIMSGHKMTDHGAEWMAEYLMKNSAITTLDLSCNALTETGVAALVNAIARRTVPCNIPLDENTLNGREHVEILEAIEIANRDETPMKVTFASVVEKHSLVATPR